MKYRDYSQYDMTRYLFLKAIGQAPKFDLNPIDIELIADINKMPHKYRNIILTALRIIGIYHWRIRNHKDLHTSYGNC
jgi:hypothetical protein